MRNREGEMVEKKEDGNRREEREKRKAKPRMREKEEGTETGNGGGEIKQMDRGRKERRGNNRAGGEQGKRRRGNRSEHRERGKRDKADNNTLEYYTGLIH